MPRSGDLQTGVAATLPGRRAALSPDRARRTSLHIASDHDTPVLSLQSKMTQKDIEQQSRS